MKCDKATFQQRCYAVLELRLNGAEMADIVRYASAQNPPWDVTERQLWNYIAAGDKLLARTLEKDREKLVNRHLAQRRNLYARALAIADFGTALRVLQDEAKLLGLYPSADVNLSGSVIVQAVAGIDDATVLGINLNPSEAV